ncbi:hypothetical protein K1T71_014094 [Dendrolimus kikuchii]|uniref:Uncharacterized protein n=1 Tax=Dendrolimus kikuchii TaxID=765133 RepID=A0ACC1CFB2_9NEOP|nr:hypothetical protein K1T71_014094 [Dendrolimus kikuchii]
MAKLLSKPHSGRWGRGSKGTQPIVMADDEEEGGFGGLYEGGHWQWDDSAGPLAFISDLPPKPVEADQIPTKALFDKV